MRSGVVRDIRNYVYDKITALPIGFFTVERKGDIMARMSGDVAEIENSIMSSLDMIFKNPVMIIACLAMMIAISWQLTIFVFVLLPVVGLVMGRVGKRLKRKSFEGQTQWGVLMSTIEETLGGLRVIKAFNAEDKLRTRFHDREPGFLPPVEHRGAPPARGTPSGAAPRGARPLSRRTRARSPHGAPGAGASAHSQKSLLCYPSF